MKNFISEFGLTFKQTCLLFSLERQIVVHDIVSSIFTLNKNKHG